MMKISVLGTRGWVDGGDVIDNDALLLACGMNTGNLMFQYSINQLLSTDNELVYVDEISDDISPEELNSSDYLIIPCADFITLEYDLEGLWNRIRWSTRPIILIGLGIGGSFELSKVGELGAFTVMVLEHFKKYAVKIFVRGAKTQEVLNSMGFSMERVHVTGCPSNFLTSNEDLRISFAEKLHCIKDFSSVNFLVYGDRYWLDAKMAIERTLYRIFRLTQGSSWVIQSHKPIVDLARPGKASSDFFTLTRDMCYLLECLNPDGYMKDMVNDLQSRYHIFTDIRRWMNFSESYDFSIGLRLHGNMISFQSGVPTLWISHDSRTNELMDLMKLPSIKPDELYNFVALKDFSLFKDRFSMFLDGYFERRNSLYSEFSNALLSVGVKVRGI